MMMITRAAAGLLAVALTSFLIHSHVVEGVINPEYLALLDECEAKKLTATQCRDWLKTKDVKVLLVKPRSENDVFYNQVVIPVDYMGHVLGGSPGNASNGMVHYPFEWKSKPMWGYGNRTIGPWDCSGLTGADCCYKIETTVVDRDIHNNLLDCWLQEAKITDDNGMALLVVKDLETGEIHRLTEEEIVKYEQQENFVRIQLMHDILTVLDLEYIKKSRAWNLVGRIREAIRGIERGQAYPGRIKNQIRQVFNKEYVPMNGVMKYCFRAVFKILTELWVAGGREHLRARDGNIVLVESNTVNWSIDDMVKFKAEFGEEEVEDEETAANATEEEEVVEGEEDGTTPATRRRLLRQETHV